MFLFSTKNINITKKHLSLIRKRARCFTMDHKGIEPVTYALRVTK
nr:MAG TPA_asm: hypothetical protein [Bacteriophage sp.]